MDYASLPGSCADIDRPQEIQVPGLARGAVCRIEIDGCAGTQNLASGFQRESFARVELDGPAAAKRSRVNGAGEIYGPVVGRQADIVRIYVVGGFNGQIARIVYPTDRY